MAKTTDFEFPPEHAAKAARAETFEQKIKFARDARQAVLQDPEPRQVDRLSRREALRLSAHDEDKGQGR